MHPLPKPWKTYYRKSMRKFSLKKKRIPTPRRKTGGSASRFSATRRMRPSWREKNCGGPHGIRLGGDWIPSNIEFQEFVEGITRICVLMLLVIFFSCLCGCFHTNVHFHDVFILHLSWYSSLNLAKGHCWWGHCQALHQWLCFFLNLNKPLICLRKFWLWVSTPWGSF